MVYTGLLGGCVRLVFDGCVVDVRKRVLIRAGEAFRLARVEAALLQHLAARPDKKVSKEEFLQQVWGYRSLRTPEIVGLTVDHLRRRLEDDSSRPRHLSQDDESVQLGSGVVLEGDEAPQDGGGSGRGFLSVDLAGSVTERVIDPLIKKIGEGTRWFTLVGDVGVGKSSIAREIVDRMSRARQVEGLPAMENHWLDLTDVRQSVNFCGALAARMGIRLIPGSNAEKGGLDARTLQLGEGLRVRGPTVVVFDEVNHVGDLLVDAISLWLEHAPELIVLVTAPQSLGGANECVVKVPALSEADAVGLACRAAGWDVDSATDQLLESAGAVVKKLDANPQAIRWALCRSGERAAALTLEEVSQRCTQLDAMDASKGPLERALGLVWADLSVLEREVLSGVSVFRGGFEVVGAANVLGVEDEEEDGPSVVSIRNVLDALWARGLLLKDKSPRVENSARYVVTPVVSDFGASQLSDSVLGEVVTARHTAFYLALGLQQAAHASVEPTVDAVHRLALELDNLVVAFERSMANKDASTATWMARAIDPVLEVMGLHQERQALWGRVLTLARDPLMKARSQLNCARARRQGGDHKGALEQADAVLNMIEGGGGSEAYGAERGLMEDPSLHALALLEKARAHQSIGEMNQAYASLLVAERLLPATADPQSHCRRQWVQGYINERSGQLNAALTLYGEALELAEQIEDWSTIVRLRLALARVAHRSGWIDKAEEHCWNAIALSRICEDQMLEGVAIETLAILNVSVGRGTDGVAGFRDALLVHQRAGHRRRVSSVEGRLGKALLTHGDEDEGIAYLESALESARRLEAGHRIGIAAGRLGIARLARGRLDEAGALLDESVRRLAKVDDIVGAVLFRSLRGVVRASRGAMDDAKADIDLARGPILASGNQIARALLSVADGYLAYAKGSKTEAREAARAGMVAAQVSTDSAFVRGEAWTLVSDLYLVSKVLDDLVSG